MKHGLSPAASQQTCSNRSRVPEGKVPKLQKSELGVQAQQPAPRCWGFSFLALEGGCGTVSGRGTL